ncbi:hypothetical protein MNV49_001374 [Pseudohyphozyma bogoriensis]|nr:hypothetical protein MNV49_001374 [Pseudohyphozyma bogoriensis]
MPASSRPRRKEHTAPDLAALSTSRTVAKTTLLSLPDEVLTNIVGSFGDYFSPDYDRGVVVAVAQTCRKLRAIASWYLDGFILATSDEAYTGMIQHFIQHPSTPSRVRMLRMGPPALPFGRIVFSHNLSNLSWLVLDFDDKFPTFPSFITDGLRNLRNLSWLSLYGTIGPFEDVSFNFGEHLPALRRLMLHDSTTAAPFAGIKSLDTLRIGTLNGTTCDIIGSMATVRNLQLYGNMMLVGPFRDQEEGVRQLAETFRMPSTPFAFGQLVRCFPNLQDLTIWGIVDEHSWTTSQGNVGTLLLNEPEAAGLIGFAQRSTRVLRIDFGWWYGVRSDSDPMTSFAFSSMQPPKWSGTEEP